MSSIGHPLLGDGVYGGGNTRFEAEHRALITGQCLHAGRLRLIHPATGEHMSFEAPMPEEMQRLLDILRREAQ
jgi:23S rRNA pseudouridine1911/1915/1917 synthase